MPTENAQILYGFAGDSKPIPFGEGDEKKALVSHPDFMMAMRAAEEAMGQKILQDNADAVRVSNLVVDQELSTLNTGTATAADCAGQLNKVYAILTNLVQLGKNNGAS